MSPKSSQAGFSLIELMMVVGIVGMLASISQQGYWQLRVKAKHLEAQTSLRTIDQLVESYAFSSVLENPNRFLVASTTIGGMGSPTYLNALASSTFTSTEDSDFFGDKRSCDVSNPIGFTVADCLKSGYKYRANGLLDTGLAVIATEVMLGRERRVHAYVDCGNASDKKIAEEFEGTYRMHPEIWTLYRGSIVYTFNPAEDREFCEEP